MECAPRPPSPPTHPAGAPAHPAAGTPLVSSRGRRLGSLCIFDLRPRRLSADALHLLACLAEMAARLLEEHQVCGGQAAPRAESWAVLILGVKVRPSEPDIWVRHLPNTHPPR